MVKYKNQQESHEKAVARGAFVNVLGLIGKAIIPVMFIAMARMYGPHIMGVFLLSYTILEIANNFTVNGLKDGMMMFLSRNIDNHEKYAEKLYTILANGFMFAGIIAIILIGAVELGGLELLQDKYRQPEVLHALHYLVYTIPFMFITTLIISATKSLMIMTWDAVINGFLRSFVFLVCMIAFWFFDKTIISIMYAFIISNVVVTIFSLFVFHRYFSFKKLINHLIRFKFFKPLLTFALPQSLNLSFSRFITDLDLLMLGYFQVDIKLIGFYGIAAQIIKNINQIRIAFSGSYSPLIARLHSAGDYIKMNNTFSMVSRWTSMIGFPVILIVGLFRVELVQIFHPSFNTETEFMLILLILPVISCTVALAFNILVMTGHSGFNLFNSLLNAGINAALNYILIPEMGLMGAAIATGIAATVNVSIVMFEVRFLEGVRLVPRRVFKPYISILLPLILSISLVQFMGYNTVLSKIVIATISLGLYLGTLYILRFEDEDKRIFSNTATTTN